VTSDDSAPCPETPEKGEDRTKIPSDQTSENKKIKNDDASGFSTTTDGTSLNISDQGERNDSGENPRVLLIKKNSESHTNLNHLRQESQKTGDICLLDYVIMNQTTEDLEQETVALVHTSSTRSLFGATRQKQSDVITHRSLSTRRNSSLVVKYTKSSSFECKRIVIVCRDRLKTSSVI
jgi:hypothetical protein